MKIKPVAKSRRVIIELGDKDDSLLDQANQGGLHLQKILVPTDFSDCSKKALQYALALAKQLNAEILVLHVVQTTAGLGEYGGFDYLYVDQQMEETAGRKLSVMLNDEVGSKIEAKAIIRKGQPAWEIVDAARELAADLIIVSTHGRTGLKRALLGSIAEVVVRHAPCPVLTVREKEREFLQPTAPKNKPIKSP